MSIFAVSVIIPAKNEESTIKEIIEKSKPYANEIIVVDGHSIDRTREIAERCGIRVILDNRKSKGDAVRVGAKEAKGDILVFIDADGSHKPNDIPKLLEPIIKGEADIVIGSRAKGGSDELVGTIDKFIRATGSGFITLLINLRFKTDLTDSQNGFRAIKKEVFHKLNLKRNDFVIEQEMIVNALKRGYRIAEEPSHEYKRQGGVRKLSTSQGFKYLIHIFFALLTP